jgi:hypothetical protein
MSYWISGAFVRVALGAYDFFELLEFRLVLFEHFLGVTADGTAMIWRTGSISFGNYVFGHSFRNCVDVWLSQYVERNCTIDLILYSDSGHIGFWYLRVQS